MLESISVFLDYVYYVLAFGVFIYVIYVLFTSRGIMAQVNQQNDYDKYLKKNGTKSFEERFLEECKNGNEGAEKILAQEEINLCNTFIGKNPNNLYAIDRRAFLYNIIEDYNEAIRDYSYLMKKEPKEFNHVKGCANMYAYINDLNTALNLINNFYRNKKKNAEYFYALGGIYDIVKDFNLVLKNYNQAIKLDPNNEFYYNRRASVYKQMGDEEKYQKDMKKYKELSKIKRDEYNKIHRSLHN